MTSGSIFVICEFDNQLPTHHTLELLSAANLIAAGSSQIIGICLGAGLDETVHSALTQRGADRVLLIDNPLFEPYQADAWVFELSSLAAEFNPGAILFAHSSLGLDCAPRLAFRLNAGIVTGCDQIEDVDDSIHWTRSSHGGNVREVVAIETTPAVATILPKSFLPLPISEDPKPDVELRPALVQSSDVRTRIESLSNSVDEDVDLERADVVVAGGRGMGGAEQFSRLEELAGILNGAVGASRVACDLKWCSASSQVGLSGKTIAPDLYLAFGISGAAQHLAGCGRSGMIVAINTDAEAEIFKSAQIGIVADCNEFLTAFVQEVRKSEHQKFQK